jgi:hypothetical protein
LLIESNWRITNQVFDNQIRIDGTAEGFFKYVVMQMLGGQFYLSWHSDYNDIRIVCDPLCIDDIIKEIEDFELREIPAHILEQARNLSYEPVIEFKGETVNVSVMTFSKWGGFTRIITTIKREYPHKIVSVQRETVLEYNCGLAF